METTKFTDLSSLEVESRRVLVRVNFDVPVKGGVVLDDFNLREALPTINELVDNGARVVLASTLGNPGGKVDPKFSMEPVAAHLAGMLKAGEVFLSDSCVGDGARQVILGLREGQVCLLENLAFHAGELRNDEKLGRQLASFCDIYVNEAFSLAGTELSSTHKICQHTRLKVPGRGFSNELAGINKLSKKTNAPLAFVLGGDSLTDNIELLDRFFSKISTLVVCGRPALTFLAARGVETGATVVENARLPLARDIMERAARRGVKIVTPADFLCEDGAVRDAQSLKEGGQVIDIGPASVKSLKATLSRAAMVIWKGHVDVAGNIKADGNQGTAKAMAASTAYTAALGESAPRAIRHAGLERTVDFVSMGREATLSMLKGRSLSAVTLLAAY